MIKSKLDRVRTRVDTWMSGQLYIPRTKTMTFGPRSFKVSVPTILESSTCQIEGFFSEQKLSQKMA